MIGTLLTFFAVAFVTLLAAWVVLMVVGTVFSLTFGLAMFLLTKVAPILLVGWVVMKLIQKVRGKDSLSPADRKWLEGE
jgi:archaellum biogenesis protein FlaJ (TadC family)